MDTSTDLLLALYGVMQSGIVQVSMLMVGVYLGLVVVVFGVHGKLGGFAARGMVLFVLLSFAMVGFFSVGNFVDGHLVGAGPPVRDLESCLRSGRECFSGPRPGEEEAVQALCRERGEWGSSCGESESVEEAE